MAKINLLTIHWGLSYGGTMQTYATLKTLRDLGHEVTLINLVHPKVKEKKLQLSFSCLLGKIRTLQFKAFRLFHFGRQTKQMYSIDSRLIPKSDFTIVGSDQVWNSDITTIIKLSYFLDFAKNTQRLSYASSFGKFEWEETEAYTSQVSSELVGFKAISVREDSGIKICKDIFGLDATQLLDPTLMHSDYSELIKNNTAIKEIFPFLLISNSKENIDICNFVSTELGLPVYQPNKFQIYLRRSPKAWLNRMKNSSYIITDSFHGLAFSILFHKQFLVVCADKKKFTRLQSLLDLFNLEDRFILSIEDLKSRKDIITSQINYDTVDAILNKERARSVGFLRNNLR